MKKKIFCVIYNNEKRTAKCFWKTGTKEVINKWLETVLEEGDSIMMRDIEKGEKEGLTEAEDKMLKSLGFKMESLGDK